MSEVEWGGIAVGKKVYLRGNEGADPSLFGEAGGVGRALCKILAKSAPLQCENWETDLGCAMVPNSPIPIPMLFPFPVSPYDVARGTDLLPDAEAGVVWKLEEACRVSFFSFFSFFVEVCDRLNIDGIVRPSRRDRIESDGNRQSPVGMLAIEGTTPSDPAEYPDRSFPPNHRSPLIAASNPVNNPPSDLVPGKTDGHVRLTGYLGRTLTVRDR